MKVKFSKHAIARAKERDLVEYLKLKELKVTEIKKSWRHDAYHYDLDECRYIVMPVRTINRMRVITMIRREGSNEVQEETSNS